MSFTFSHQAWPWRHAAASFARLCGRQPGLVLAVGLLAATSLHGAQLWQGPVTQFTQAGNADQLTANVWITRDAIMGIYNARTEAGYDKIGGHSPADTEWAYGKLSDYATLTYAPWVAWNGKSPPSMLDREAVLHLISEDIYLAVKFTAWGGSSGGFSWQRSTPGPAANLAPTAQLTAPADGAIVAAPWSGTLLAATADPDGTVALVEFFANGTRLGSVTNPAAASSLRVTNLAAGAYVLSAVATDNAGGTTTATTALLVVTPAPIVLRQPRRASTQAFEFIHSATAGLRYVVRRSTNGVTWAPCQTNTAAGTDVTVRDEGATGSFTLYSAGRLPNP
jgi:hypothetical protein